VSLLKKNYIPLLIYNFDELVMSLENRKNFTYIFFFVKNGALQRTCVGVLSLLYSVQDSVIQIDINNKSIPYAYDSQA